MHVRLEELIMPIELLQSWK